MKLYISVDPGKNVGVATWDEHGNFLRKTIFALEDFETYLGSLLDRKHEILAFIVEEYRVYGSKAHAHIGSKVETAQCIGKIKMIAKLLGVPVVEQPATILNGAAKWAGVKRSGSHWKDDVSAYLHGYYYLHKTKKLIRARVLDERKAE